MSVEGMSPEEDFIIQKLKENDGTLGYKALQDWFVG